MTGPNGMGPLRPSGGGVAVTIDQAAGQADPTSFSHVLFTAVFAQAVTGFATGDVTISGTAGATLAEVTGSGTTYTISVSGMTGDGTITVDIPAGVAAAGSLQNLASTSTDNTVTWTEASTTTFTSPGNNDIVIPVGVTQAEIDLVGAQGGGPTGTEGGWPGKLSFLLTVTPGETLRFAVGGTTTNRTAGVNGGGGGAGAGNGLGGGGATDVRRTPYALADRIAVAGGGGGAPFGATNGSTLGLGAGNGPGTDGYDPPAEAGANQGRGATVSAGGIGGTSDGTWSGGPPGTTGTLGQGGACADYNGGGGGGGIYGGGGGGGCNPTSGGGGGGSGGILGGTTTLLSAATGVTPENAGHGKATIRWNGVEIAAIDDFNRANGSIHASGIWWVNAGTMAIVSNQLSASGSGVKSCQAGRGSISATNHYSEIDVISGSAGQVVGTSVRQISTSNSRSYMGVVDRTGADTYQIIERFNSINTVIASFVGAIPTEPYRLRTKIIGGEITLSLKVGNAWVQKVQATDFSYTTGDFYCGLFVEGTGTVVLDNFKQGNA